MHQPRILFIAILAVVLAVAAALPAGAEDKTITDAHQTINAALGQKDFKTVWAQSHIILEAAAKRDAATLTGPELYAIGVAHYYVVAETLDQALKVGGLTADQVTRGKSMRDRIMGADYSPTASLEGALIAASAPGAGVAAGAGFVPGQVRTISHGQQVNLQDYVVPGKTTIFDFYSPFCGPCQQLSPRLDKLAQARTDLNVVKVDINRPGKQAIDWDSPVARQYNLEGTPFLKVYGPDGKLQAQGDPAYTLVTGWCGG